jgi:organic hydroperoxide reductase OsmC/OhrA
VAADGVCGKRPDGHFGFTSLSLRLELETDADRVRAVELAERAEESCLVAASLDVPIETTIVVVGC